MRALSYRPEIDGLRSIAVLSVILYHAGLPGFSGGFVGVDVFFVISGYLITSIIYPEVCEGRFSFAAFYERRVRRLFPALFVVLLACTISAALLLTPGQLKDFGQSLIAVNVFASNIYFFLKTGYFSPQAQEVPLLHTWSLAVEEQFYLAFPVVLMLLRRWAPRRIAPWLTALALATLALCIARAHGASATLNFFDAVGRAWELLLGALLAYRHDSRPPSDQPGPTNTAGAWLGLGLVVATIFGFQPGWAHPGWSTLAPVIGAGLLIHCTAAPSPVRALLRSRPAVHIGLISYSAYLWHQPMFAFAHVLRPGHWPLQLTAALIAACLVVAHLSWRWVERPWRKRGTVSTKTVWLLAAAGAAALMAAGLAAHLTGGFPARYGQQAEALRSTMAFSPYRARCHTEGVNYLKPAAACRLLDDKNVQWATLGDSHSVELAYALAGKLHASGRGGLLALSSSGCQPALDFVSDVPGCTAWLREAVAHLEQAPTIQHVVLVWRHGLYLHGDSRNWYPALPQEAPNFLRQLPEQQARAQYFSSLQSVVTRLLAAGKQVYLLDPVPELGTHAERLVFGNAGPEALVPDRNWYARRHQDLLQQFDQLQLPPVLASRLHRVHSADAFCTGTACAARDDHQIWYFDDNHPSLAGAERLADLVLRADSPLPAASTPQ